MMPKAQELSSRRMYDTHSINYDNCEHPFHAAKYIRRAQPHTGQHKIDLARRINLVTLLAKQAIGPADTVTGAVTGTTNSSGMMAVARGKAENEGLAMEWLDCDISDLDHAEPQGELPEKFDLITCATALVLPIDLAKGIVPWETEMEGTAPERSGRANWESNYRGYSASRLPSLQQLFLAAGLEIEDAWRAGENGGRGELTAGAAGGHLNESVEHGIWAVFCVVRVIEKARNAFEPRMVIVDFTSL